MKATRWLESNPGVYTREFDASHIGCVVAGDGAAAWSVGHLCRTDIMGVTRFASTVLAAKRAATAEWKRMKGGAS
jgi:hypothetical protein